MSLFFSAFTPLAGGRSETYGYPVEYPYDLDASLDFTRMTGTFSPMPFPQTIGFVAGLCPMLNQLQRDLTQVKSPNGPYTGISSAPVNVIFPNDMGGLSKIKG